MPLHALLPFLVGLAHQYGLLKWVNPQWFTLRYWKRRFSGGTAPPAAAAAVKAE